ncbi:MAG: carbohydrate ABC transporter permease [Spirochaetes bacterium]|nr:carbohydrate ABC transporter permease [Spirochaetota bacterium]
MSEAMSIPVRIRMAPKRIWLLVMEIAMILLAVAFIYPAIYVVINAFKSTSEIQMNPAGLPKAASFANFLRVWSAEGSGGINFLHALVNTILLTLGAVTGVILFSSMAAYILVRTKSRTSTSLYFMFAFFLVIPFQTIMVSLVVLATDLGFTNVFGLIVMYIGLGAPTAVFMFHGFIKGVPLSLEESAAIDGAGTFRIFFQIVFPLLTPITATIGILDVLWVWNDFLLPFIILRKGTLVLFQFNFFGTFTKDYGALTASLVMSATPVVILYLSLQRYIIKGIAAGAVKG